jgi:hypothetical protein
MWELGAACIRPDAVFVSGVPDGLYTREPTRDVGHKMKCYLVLGGATGKRFSPFLIRHPPNDATGDALTWYVNEENWLITRLPRMKRHKTRHAQLRAQ